MNKWIKRILRGIISFFFVTFLAIAIVLFSILTHINGSTYQGILGDAAFEVFEQELEESGSSLDELYLFLEPACQQDESILVSQEIELNCDELTGQSQEGFESYLKEELSSELETRIDLELVNRDQLILGIKIHSLSSLFSLLRQSINLFFIASFFLLIILVTLESPKYKAFTHLGGTGIAIGFPFMFINKLNLGSSFDESVTLSSLKDSIFGTLHSYLLLAFIIGIFLLTIGIIWGIYYKKRHKHKNSGKVLKRNKGSSSNVGKRGNEKSNGNG